jgi:hypothetical protein
VHLMLTEKNPRRGAPSSVTSCQNLLGRPKKFGLEDVAGLATYFVNDGVECCFPFHGPFHFRFCALRSNGKDIYGLSFPTLEVVLLHSCLYGTTCWPIGNVLTCADSDKKFNVLSRG